MPRSNPQIWRVAKYLHTYTSDSQLDYPWDGVYSDEEEKNNYYDIAAELLKRLEGHEFTGSDNHKD